MPVLTGLLLTLATTLLPAWGPVEPAPVRDGVWPLDPRPEVVEGFDPPIQRWGAGHRGVDLLGRAGQPVRAATAGSVTFAGRLAGRGVVVVDHGDVRTTYEPVDAVVHVGDPVTRGQQIGTLRLALSHCFPRACLHWGLLRGDTYLDPLTLVGAGPVRLLPLAAPLPISPLPISPLPISPLPVSSPPVSALVVRPVGGPGGRPGAADPW